MKWMTTVPSTDAEVVECFTEMHDTFISRTMVHLFECYRGMGKPTLDAYKETLRDLIRSAGYKFDERGRLSHRPSGEPIT